MGKTFCAKHERFFEQGEGCDYCVPEEATAAPAESPGAAFNRALGYWLDQPMQFTPWKSGPAEPLPPISPEKLQKQMDEMWVKMDRLDAVENAAILAHGFDEDGEQVSGWLPDETLAPREVWSPTTASSTPAPRPSDACLCGTVSMSGLAPDAVFYESSSTRWHERTRCGEGFRPIDFKRIADDVVKEMAAEHPDASFGWMFAMDRDAMIFHARVEGPKESVTGVATITCMETLRSHMESMARAMIKGRIFLALNNARQHAKAQQ